MEFSITETSTGEDGKKKVILDNVSKHTMQLIDIDTVECPKCGRRRDLREAIELLGRY